MDMSWSQAVNYVNTIGPICSILFLFYPLNIFYWKKRMRKNWPDKSLMFGKIILFIWFAIIIYFIALFATGAWYSESSGSTPQQAALVVTIELVVIITLHFMLLATGHKERAKRNKTHEKNS